MKVALIAASGNAGSRILAELAARGHQVTAVVRHPEKVPATPGVTVTVGDANQPETLAKIMAGHDAVISAAKFLHTKPENLIAAVRASGVKRYLTVGGAGSLRHPDGSLEMDGPRFPAHVKPEATEGGRFLDLLKPTTDLDWTYLSPSQMFEPGERTGTFRLGAENLLSDANGRGGISMEDFAIAMADELEHPKHTRQRFTFGY
jgi:putative NADH-flavin reductase